MTKLDMPAMAQPVTLDAYGDITVASDHDTDYMGLTKREQACLTDEEIKINFEEAGDAYGKSWRCKECGKNQFYTQKPVRCPHTPLSWEVKLKEQDNG